MKKYLLMLCLFLAVGCAHQQRDTMNGLPDEIRNHPVFSAAGTRNGSAYRTGSPERGFFNIHSNRGYSGTEYNGTNGHGWRVNTSNGRVTSWSIW